MSFGDHVSFCTFPAPIMLDPPPWTHNSPGKFVLLRAWQALMSVGRWRCIPGLQSIRMLVIPHCQGPHNNAPSLPSSASHPLWSPPGTKQRLEEAQIPYGDKIREAMLVPEEHDNPHILSWVFSPFDPPSIWLLSIFLLFSPVLTSPLPSSPLLSPLSSVDLCL